MINSKNLRLIIFSAAMGLAGSASAQDQTKVDRFVNANLYSTFYHELGHAIIDLQDVVLFGQEEDAADTLSSYLIHALHTPEEIKHMMVDVALGYEADAVTLRDDGGKVDFTSVHGPDLQRKFNHLCQLAGGDMDVRAQTALSYGLSEDRLDNCEEEFYNANYSWGRIMRGLARSEATGELRIDGFRKYRRSEIGVFSETVVAKFNERYNFPTDIRVRIEPCGQPNAFYDADLKMIIMCTEYPADIRKNFEIVEDRY